MCGCVCSLELFGSLVFCGFCPLGILDLPQRNGSHQGADDTDKTCHICDWKCKEAGRGEDDSGSVHSFPVPQARL